MRCRVTLFVGLALATALALVPARVRAVDGVIEINQARALAGSVTSGDAPGFPVSLNAPGSYRLTSDLRVPDENTGAIFISAADVTLDLNGFAITGVTACAGSPLVCAPTGSGRGVAATSVDGVTVRNGTIRGMGSCGVCLVDRARVEDVRVISNGGNGITVDDNAVVRACTALRNGFSGIAAGLGANASGNIASFNGQEGIRAFDGSAVVGNTARGNGGFGLLGVGAGYGKNVFTANNGGDSEVQAGGGVQVGQNLCGTVLCP